MCRLCEAAKKLGVPPPVSIQNDFSLLDRRFEGHLAEACAPSHLNIGLLPCESAASRFRKSVCEPLPLCASWLSPQSQAAAASQQHFSRAGAAPADG